MAYQSDYVKYIPKRSHSFKQFMKALKKLGYNDCNEWVIYKKSSSDDDPKNVSILNKQPNKCLCGQQITNYYHIFNKKDNTKFIRCGSTCIKEFFGKYALNEICLRCDDILKHNIKSRKCKNCRTIENKTKNNNKKLFKQLLKKAEEVARSLRYDREIEAEEQALKLEKERTRQMIEGNYCLKCEYFIGNPLYKICYKCNHKKCPECGKLNIKIDSNYKICFMCNKKK